jgi:hypothetical protein
MWNRSSPYLEYVINRVLTVTKKAQQLQFGFSILNHMLKGLHYTWFSGFPFFLSVFLKSKLNLEKYFQNSIKNSSKCHVFLYCVGSFLFYCNMFNVFFLLNNYLLHFLYIGDLMLWKMSIRAIHVSMVQNWVIITEWFLLYSISTVNINFGFAMPKKSVIEIFTEFWRVSMKFLSFCRSYYHFW